MLNGRALSLTAVTLDANSITIPGPAPAGRSAMAPMVADDLSAGVQETTAIQNTTATADPSTTAAPSTETAIETALATSPGTCRRCCKRRPQSLSSPADPVGVKHARHATGGGSQRRGINRTRLAVEPGPTTGFSVTGEVTAP